MKTVFEKILDKSLPCDAVYETDTILAFRDINPVAPTHIVIIPKLKKFESLEECDDMDIIHDIFMAVKAIKTKLGITNGYRVVTNVGKDAGQCVPYLHFHFIAGCELGPLSTS